MGKAIQDYNALYMILRPAIRFSARCHYYHFIIKGKENLPKEGGYIIAPCHQQALMEPLAVLYFAPKPTVFLARADIFEKPILNKIFTFLKIMPVYRIRDGKDKLSKNTEIFEKSRDVILDGYPLCLMAEGRHNNRHQLLPLVKGMFRIAGETQTRLGDKPLYIVPTGIDFDEYERPYANVVINIGEPIPVQEYMQTFQENEPLALNQMRTALTAALKGQMHHIDSQEHYEEFLTLCKFENRDYRKARGLWNNPWTRFQMRQVIAHDLDELENRATAENAAEEERQALQSKLDKAHLLQELCKRKGIKESVAAEKWHWARLAISLVSMAGVLVASFAVDWFRWVLLFLILCYPIPFFPTYRIPKRLIKDSQFRSSVNFGIRFVLSFLWITVISIVMACTQGAWLGSHLQEQFGFHMHWFLWGLLTYVLCFVLARCAAPLIRWFRCTWDNIKFIVK